MRGCAPGSSMTSSAIRWRWRNSRTCRSRFRAPQYSQQPYPYADLNPHINRLFEVYGPQRSYWGTDITNGALEKATYRQRIAHFTEALDFMSEDDKDWVMGRGITARLKGP